METNTAAQTATRQKSLDSRSSNFGRTSIIAITGPKYRRWSDARKTYVDRNTFRLTINSTIQLHNPDFNTLFNAATVYHLSGKKSLHDHWFAVTGRHVDTGCLIR